MFTQLFFIPTILLLALAAALILGLLPRNRIIGIRTPETLANDAVWYQANRFGGWMYLAAGTIYMLVAAFIPNTSSSDRNMAVWLIHVSAFVIPVIVSGILIRRYIKNLGNE